MEWISISGIAFLTRDKSTIEELYESDWKAWFPNEGDPRHGTPDDPRLVLIGVHVHSAVFFEVNKPRPVVLFEIVKGWLTGSEPKVGELHHLDVPETRKTGT
jgi:general stress protein 26